MKFVVAALLCSSLCCATPEPAQVRESPPTSDLAPIVDPIFAPWNRSDSPGCAVGVIQDGELVFARGYGMANLEHAIPITPETVFDVGSVSKQFTAACVVLLAQDGRLSLDDDVRKHVPELPVYEQPITLRHLLHHTSGLRDYLFLFALAGVDTEDWTGEEEALAMIARQKGLDFPPGEQHAYSNSGYFLLSVVVERACGRSLADFARARIFEPLEMHETHFHDDHTLVVPRRATGHAPRAGGGFGLAMSDFEQTGDGGVMTTVRDLAKWDANFYSGKVGGRGLIDTLQTPGRLNDGTVLDYALGLTVSDHAGLKWVAHGGAWAGYRAQMLRFPEKKLTVICLANAASIDPSALCWRVAAACLGDALAPRSKEPPRTESDAAAPAPAPQLTSEQLKQFAGEYESEELGVVYVIALDGAQLTVGLHIDRRLPLSPVSENVFEIGGVLLRFQREADGSVGDMELELGRTRGIRFARKATAAD